MQRLRRTEGPRVLAVMALLLGPAALAHDLTCRTTVNGGATALVTTYPATLQFHYDVDNVHPTLPSTLLSAEDPLFAPFGWAFTPAPPVDVPVGGTVSYDFSHTVNNYHDCLALAGITGDVPPTVTFTDTLMIGWDSGAAQCSTQVECRPADTFTCDDTIYVTSREGGTTNLYTLDPLTQAITPVATTDQFGYDAIGFNHLDGLIYGISNVNASGDPTPHLVQATPSGDVTDLGPLAGLAGEEWIIGTVLEDGTFMIGSFGTAWRKIDLATRTITESGNYPFFNPSAWAASPLDGLVYGYQSFFQQLTVLDPATNVNTAYGPTMTNVGVQPCSSAFTQAGVYYLYCKTTDPLVDRLFTVDLVNSVATPLSTGIALGAGDMASCVFPPTTGPRPARDRGFFLTHAQPLAACLEQGPISLGREGKIETLHQAQTLLWSSPAVDVNGRVRTEERAARVELAREVLVATCNDRLLPASDSLREALEDAKRPLMSSGAGATEVFERLRTLHRQGMPLPARLDAGPASAGLPVSTTTANEGSR